MKQVIKPSVFIAIKLCIGLFIAQLPIAAQINNTYFPVVKNFKRSDYKAGLQTWMIAQAPNELMYFANNHGLLEFDGHNWQLYGFDKYNIVRSIYTSNDGKIYVGLTNNFGYFYNDSTGRQQFYSLMNLLPAEYKSLQEIWRIHKTPDGIVFQTFNELIVYHDNKLNVYPAPGRFYLSFQINNKLYVVDWNNGILEFQNGKYTLLEGSNQFSHSDICAILPYGKDLMIVTTEDGVYIYRNNRIEQWDAPCVNYLKENQIYSAIRLDEDRIVFGTIQKGILITDNAGNPRIALDKSKGLQNNTILSMNIDKSGNLWLGTDNGIDQVFINSPISQLDVNQNIGSGYAAVIHNNILYLGTNQGIFFKYLNPGTIHENQDFKLIKNTKGQVWNLQVIDDVLFCGHNKGAFIIKGENAVKIGEDIPGVWKFIKSVKHPDIIIAGTYTGFIQLKKKNGQWDFSKRIDGFNESSRMFYFDKDESIWMSHGFKGVYHIAFDDNFESVTGVNFYNTKKGFWVDFGINATKIQDQLVFLCSEGAFRYNQAKDTIEPSAYFNGFFNNKKVNNAIEDAYGNVWYYWKDSIGVKMIKNDGTYKDVVMPFKQLQNHFIEGFQSVYSINESNALISYENGFVHYNAEQNDNSPKPFSRYLNRVELSKSNSVIFTGHLFTGNSPDGQPKINFNDNNIHFFYSAVNFDNPDQIEFSTLLEGYDTKWTNWQNRYDREFTNLPEGRYIFKIKTRNVNQTETEPLAYYFTILPPWWRNPIAYALYIAFIILLTLLIIYIIRLRIEFLKAREIKLQQEKYKEREKELQQEALLAEKEIIRLKNEQLSDKLKTKDKELANSTMETIKKNKFLISLKNDLQKNSNDIKSPTAKNNVKKLIRKIDNELNDENTWQVFETHFGNVHEEFLIKLKQLYPQISPAELRLAACLRMNISSKEIATLLNISLRGVEASRYRLRKSLNLDRSVNLTDFILSI